MPRDMCMARASAAVNAIRAASTSWNGLGASPSAWLEQLAEEVPEPLADLLLDRPPRPGAGLQLVRAREVGLEVAGDRRRQRRLGDGHGQLVVQLERAVV